MKIVTLSMLPALLLASAADAQNACLSDPEAESLTLVALPDILRETGRVCAARLAGKSPLAQGHGTLVARYQAAADSAWPTARGAIGKLSNPTVGILLQSDYARPVLTSLLVPLIVGRIAVGDCPVIDRIVTQLAPLPPRNTASLVVTTLKYLKSEKAKGKPVEVPDLPLCEANSN